MSINFICYDYRDLKLAKVYVGVSNDDYRLDLIMLDINFISRSHNFRWKLLAITIVYYCVNHNFATMDYDMNAIGKLTIDCNRNIKQHLWALVHLSKQTYLVDKLHKDSNLEVLIWGIFTSRFTIRVTNCTSILSKNFFGKRNFPSVWNIHKDFRTIKWGSKSRRN